MRYRLFLLIVIAAACAFPQDTSARTRREKRHTREKKEFTIKPTRLTVVPRLMAGILTGSAASDIKDINAGNSNLVLYGLGVAVEYNPAVQSALGLNVEVDWKKLPTAIKESDKKSVRAIAVSGSWLFRFLPLNRNSVYTRTELGVMWARIPDYFVPVQRNGSNDLRLGRRSYFRVGIGLMTYNTPTAAMRIEVWHKTVLSGEFPDGQHYDRLSRYRYSITSVGLELAFGFGL